MATAVAQNPPITAPPHSPNHPAQDIPPAQTLYINRLNDKVPKEELKRALYAIFARYGQILDVVALKTYKMRGQAWVVFHDVTAATNALRDMQSFPFYNKPMNISFAKSKSDAVAKLDGTYTEKKKVEKRKVIEEEAGAPKKSSKAKEPKVKKEKSEGGSNLQPRPAPPNKILFIENLPEQVNEMMLSMLFQQFPGYKEVRLVPGKKGIAFVEFEDEVQAGVAMEGLQMFKIAPEIHMVISFAKK